jgi:hypothetical protein
MAGGDRTQKSSSPQPASDGGWTSPAGAPGLLPYPFLFSWLLGLLLRRRKRPFFFLFFSSPVTKEKSERRRKTKNPRAGAAAAASRGRARGKLPTLNRLLMISANPTRKGRSPGQQDRKELPVGLAVGGVIN